MQGCVKFITVIYNARRISEKVELLRHMYACNTDGSTANYAILRRWSLVFGTVSRAGIAILVCSCMTLLPLTMASNWWRGENELPLPLLLPAIDVHSTVGWWLTYGFDVSMLVLGAFGLCATDLLLLMFVLHMWPMCELFAAEFEQLNAVVRHGGIAVANKAQLRRLKWFFRNLLRIHIDMCEYVGKRGVVRVWFAIAAMCVSVCFAATSAPFRRYTFSSFLWKSIRTPCPCAQ